MAEATSISNGPLIAKILIDLSEYNVLLEAKQYFDQFQHKTKENFKYKPEKQLKLEKDVEKEVEIPLNNLQDLNEKEKIELGTPSSEDIKDLITKIVQEQIKSELKKQVQVGGSFSDLAPGSPKEVENFDEQPPSATNILKKPNEHNQFDDNFLIQKVSPKNRPKALKVLEAINARGNNITWNSSGNVIIDNQGIPNSNISQLLNEVFKGNPNKKMPGILEFVNELAALGEGHLLHKNLLRGTQRREEIEKQNEHYQYIKSRDNWFYIGP